jgi:hypothetical protein
MELRRGMARRMCLYWVLREVFSSVRARIRDSCSLGRVSYVYVCVVVEGCMWNLDGVADGKSAVWTGTIPSSSRASGRESSSSSVGY